MTVRVGGQAMFPSETIVANAVNSADHTTLVTAVKAAALIDPLNGPGPLTVFTPPMPHSPPCALADESRQTRQAKAACSMMKSG